MAREKPQFFMIDGENNRVADIKGSIVHVSQDRTLVTFQLMAQITLNPGEIAPAGGGLAVVVIVTKTPDQHTYDPAPSGRG